VLSNLQRKTSTLQGLEASFPEKLRRAAAAAHERLERARLRLELLDPRLVLQRGYAWLADLDGSAVTRGRQTHVGQALRATLADGEVDLTVAPQRLI
ncbi:MAG: exodeoxyribonuclease VII large subunit, partial [Burkholderiales bacterium]|nr:exodeoxyribonuclease VII large subunit [Burkholderiales bacterium]